LAEARPFAFRPPLGFLPSALCHAGVFAIYFFFPVFLAFLQLAQLHLQFLSGLPGLHLQLHPALVHITSSCPFSSYQKPS
jgi:hypothetical protein